MDSLIANLDSFLKRVELGEDTVLEPRQLETFIKIVDFLKSGRREGYVINPTGTGKTVVFTKLLEAILKDLSLRAIVVGSTKINLHQNRWKLEEFGEINAGAVCTGARDYSRQVTVTTYHSLRNAVKLERIKPREYDIIILDEAHRGIGRKTVTAVDSFEENVIKIGFTATPEFSEEHSVTNLLPYTIDEMSVREAIDNNLLAGLKVFVMTTAMSAENIAVSGNDYEEVALTQAINTTERNRFVAKLYLDERFNGKRTVVYGASRQHAKALVVAFEQEGIPVAYIDGMTTDDDREKILEKFKTGEIKVLCNVRVLVESFDESEAEVCFNAVPTMSKVIAEQRGGRILRRSRVRDSKIGYIVEILDEFGESQNTPVLYSEIAGAAEILSPSNRKEKEKEEKLAKPKQVRKVGTSRKKSEPKPGEVVDDPSVIMDLTNRNKRQRFTKMFEYAPSGWVHPRRLAHELHTKESEIRDFAETQSADHADWFKRYLTPLDILTGHYHPLLVTQVRRHFDDRLKDMMSPAEFAELMVMDEAQAKANLEAADEAAPEKAVRFDEQAYFSRKAHGEIIRREQYRYHFEELLQVEEAEQRFWEDDERKDGERELEYWATFSPITSERFGVDPSETELEPDPLLHGEEVVQFDDDLTVPAWEDLGDDSQTITDRQCQAIRQVVETLPVTEAAAIRGLYFESRSRSSVANSSEVSGQGVSVREIRGIKLLRSQARLMFLLKSGIIDFDTARGLVNGYGVPSYRDRTPDDVKPLLRKLEREFGELLSQGSTDLLVEYQREWLAKQLWTAVHSPLGW